MSPALKKKRQPIADKVLRRLDRDAKAKVVDLSNLRTSRKVVADLESSVIDDEALSQLPPCVALYTLVQNHLSVIAEVLLQLPALHRIEEFLSDAHATYLPAGPPMSPLTASFFTNWSQYDVAFGLGRETLTTISMAVARKYGMHASFLSLAQAMSDSRCGLYEHLGNEGDILYFTELWTNREVLVLSATGHKGTPGEIWYTRLLPPNNQLPDVHVNFNTPYVMHEGTTKETWLASIERTLAKEQNPEQAFHHYMKYGPEPRYWTDYILEAYMNHTADVIWLQGVPDRAQTRPHARSETLDF